MTRHLQTLFAGLVFFSLALTQVRAEPPRRPPADSRATTLEVVVTDKKGNPVSGLGAEDLELRIDKRDYAVTAVDELRDGKIVSAADSEDAQEAAPGVHVLIFIDEHFNRDWERDRVLDRLEPQLQSLGSGDRVAVVAFDGGITEALSEWVTPENLPDLLQQAKERPAQGMFTSVEMARANPAPGPLGIRSTPFNSPTNQHPLDERTRQVVEWLNNVSVAVSDSLLDYSDARGRKVAILLSGGWPASPSHFVFGPSNEGAAPDDRQGLRIFQPVVEAANRTGFTLYPVDVPGITPPDAQPEDARRRHRSVNADLHETLLSMADQTGGLALIDTKRLGVGDTVMRDARTYYRIHFNPTWEQDEVMRKVRIKLKKRGLKIRHRPRLGNMPREDREPRVRDRKTRW